MTRPLCQHCHEPFEPNPNLPPGRQNSKRYCSVRCRRLAGKARARSRQTRLCKVCGATITTPHTLFCDDPTCRQHALDASRQRWNAKRRKTKR